MRLVIRPLAKRFLAKPLKGLLLIAAGVAVLSSPAVAGERAVG